VLEDFGDALFARVIEAGEDETPLYLAAIEALVRLHEAGIRPRSCRAPAATGRC
jgi:aminoglycoside/choline kinase family phosphotransferase